MGTALAIIGWLALGFFAGGTALQGFTQWQRRRRRDFVPVVELAKAHLAPLAVDAITISEREFPSRVRADLQKAIDQLLASGITICDFHGVRKRYSHHEPVVLTDCIVEDENYPTMAVPPEYEEVDVGEEEPVRCLKNGVWLLAKGPIRFLALLTPIPHFQREPGMKFQIGIADAEDGVRITREFFKHLEDAIRRADSYRGKILSLEAADNSYSGAATGITVHKLRTVERDQVILPAKTVDLLDRNIIQFVRQREQLARFRQATKKGILFYGPPGTGKTHTIHYLARALPGHTTLLVSAEQVGLLAEYMTLARLLQPSIVVMEDVDLIARERTSMNSACEEVLLNKLLNEMDGLKEEADILFILTTNRPETLEAALASRPGRVDQAIEFPFPDEEGRRKLIRLYSPAIEVPEAVMQAIVRRTDRVSGAFIKELMRRSIQFHIEHNGTSTLELADVEQALDEMLISGGSLNLKLLGASVEGR